MGALVVCDRSIAGLDALLMQATLDRFATPLRRAAIPALIRARAVFASVKPSDPLAAHGACRDADDDPFLALAARASTRVRSDADCRRWATGVAFRWARPRAIWRRSRDHRRIILADADRRSACRAVRRVLSLREGARQTLGPDRGVAVSRRCDVRCGHDGRWRYAESQRLPIG